MCKRNDLIMYSKGQVWRITDENWTKDMHDSSLTVGDRPCIIYNAINNGCKYVTVIPCTSNSSRNGVKLKFVDGIETVALVQEIRPVHINSIKGFTGCLSPHAIEKIDEALKIYLGMIVNKDLEDKYFPMLNDVAGNNDYKNPQQKVTAPPVKQDNKNDKIIYPFKGPSTSNSENNSKVSNNTPANNNPTKNDTPANKTHAKTENIKKSESVNLSKSQNTPKPTNTNNSTQKSNKPVKKRIKWNELSDDEKQFILTEDMQTVADLFNVCVDTVKRQRRKFEEEMEQKKKTENTVTPPHNNKEEPKSSNGGYKWYNNSTYRSFKINKIKNPNLMSKNEKKLFLRLDPKVFVRLHIVSSVEEIENAKKVIREQGIQ